MNIAEHYMASDVEWDPTGRYVVTSVSWWSHKVQALCILGTEETRPCWAVADSPPLGYEFQASVTSSHGAGIAADLLTIRAQAKLPLDTSQQGF